MLLKIGVIFTMTASRGNIPDIFKNV